MERVNCYYTHINDANYMKEHKTLHLTFIILSLTFILVFVNACGKEHRQIQLQIKTVTDGMAISAGELLFFRMYDNREIEFDLVRNEEAPLSESNVVRKKMVLSEQDAREIQSIVQNILEGLENSDLKESYPPPPSNQPLPDVFHYTVFDFNNGKGQMRSIVIALERRRLMGSAYEQTYPKPLIKLLKKVTDVRRLESN